MHERILYQLQHLRGQALAAGFSLDDLQQPLQNLEAVIERECGQAEQEAVTRLVDAFRSAMAQELGR